MREKGGFAAITAPFFRIYDIPAHLPFLDCLAAGVGSGAEVAPV